jgi:hypothetical protein
MLLFPFFYFKSSPNDLLDLKLPFVPLVPGSGQQFSVLVFTHFFFSFLDYTAQKITSKNKIN